MFAIKQHEQAAHLSHVLQVGIHPFRASKDAASGIHREAKQCQCDEDDDCMHTGWPLAHNCRTIQYISQKVGPWSYCLSDAVLQCSRRQAEG